ncbi:hypothetical protein B0H21DRAFT_775936 [Amylocystis lapponica]|nr:hypothetical protein B0H21DRAFT_775936 [Amylocystis lapponica]
MSSISFPYAGPGHASSSSGQDHDHFSPAFDAISDSSFQMNPLSSHPPRTPRTSVIYGNGEDVQEKTRTYEVDTEDGDDDKSHMASQSQVRKEEVWRELLITSNGRIKHSYKIIQYSLRLYLLFHTTVTAASALRNKSRANWEIELVKRLESAIGGFSLTRKCLIMFNWLAPLTAILAQHSSDPSFSEHSASMHKTKRKPLLHTFLHASPPVLLELINGLSDDVYTFSRLGLLSKRTGERAGRFADWCWFASTLVNLVENTVERGVILSLQHEVESRLYTESMAGTTTKSNPAATKVDEKELVRLQRQDYWIQVTRYKLLMDLIFVSYNVFHLRRAKGQIQTFTGLAAAA